jgi:AcrR family transcriptional regulator
MIEHVSSGLIGKDPRALSSDEAILLAALLRFVEKGYHGATIREVAQRSGVSVAGLYHHFPSKLELLERLIDKTMDDLIATTENAQADARFDPAAQLESVVVAHVFFHCHRPEESFVGNSELRSLSDDGRRRIVGKRDRQQRIVDKR